MLSPWMDCGWSQPGPEKVVAASWIAADGRGQCFIFTCFENERLVSFITALPLSFSPSCLPVTTLLWYKKGLNELLFYLSFLVFLFPAALNAIRDTINHPPLFVCPLSSSCLSTWRRASTKVLFVSVCLCVKTAGPWGWGGLLVEGVESRWANEAPDRRYRSASQRCLAQTSWEESSRSGHPDVQLHVMYPPRHRRHHGQPSIFKGLTAFVSENRSLRLIQYYSAVFSCWWQHLVVWRLHLVLEIS